MKNSILFTVFFFWFNFSHGQSSGQFLYGYDAGGNRTSRMYMGPRMANPNATDDSLDAKGYSQPISSLTATIFPSPTRGDLKIEFKNKEADEKVLIEVFDMKATRLIKKETVENNYNIDITSYPQGDYIIRITGNKKYKEWEVVKMQ